MTFHHISFSDVYIFLMRTTQPPTRKREACSHNVNNQTLCPLTPLKNIVLALMFNNAHYSSIPLLKNFYAPVFAQLVFCSPEGDLRYDVISTGGRQGWLGYNCLTLASKLYPHYDGYLYGNDDSVINWWNLYKHDVTKLWFHVNVHELVLHEVGKPTDAWYWWKKTDALNRFDESLRDIIQVSNRDNRAGRIARHALHNYFHATEGRIGVRRNYSDVFYIPHGKIESFVFLSEIFVKNSLWLEIAVPTLLMFLDNGVNNKRGISPPMSDISILCGVYLPDLYNRRGRKYETGEAFYETYDFDMTFIHPFKFDRGMHDASKNFFMNIIQKYGDVRMEYCQHKLQHG